MTDRKIFIMLISTIIPLLIIGVLEQTTQTFINNIFPFIVIAAAVALVIELTIVAHKIVKDLKDDNK